MTLECKMGELKPWIHKIIELRPKAVIDSYVSIVSITGIQLADLQ
jgi:hypothetical protein